MNDNYLISSVHVANSILKKIKEEKYDIPVNPLKLYNLVFLLYANYLYKTGRKLFTEQFVVTEKGPVSPYVYSKFNCWKNKPIMEYATDSVGEVYFLKKSSIFDECLTETIDRYVLVNDCDLLQTILSFIPNKKEILDDMDIIKAEELRRNIKTPVDDTSSNKKKFVVKIKRNKVKKN